MVKGKVCHLTTVHPALDPRIFHKECKSLAKAGYQVSLIHGEEHSNSIDGVQLIGLQTRKMGRIKRLFLGGWLALFKALQTKASIIHFHDPELLWVGFVLRLFGKKVIYDSHEDVPRQILSKTYLPEGSKKIISAAWEFFENTIVKTLSGTVAPTPTIQQRFSFKKDRSIMVANFPPKTTATVEKPRFIDRKDCIVYIGSLGKVRGIKEMVEAQSNIDCTFILGGNWWDKNYQKEVEKLPGWKQVDFRGFVDRAGMKSALDQAKIGLVVLHPTLAYKEAYAVKMFEYMAAGIPVICSDFPLWKSIIDPINCGISVKPKDQKELEKAILYLLENPSISKEMGERGRLAILNKYNWESQVQNLENLYKNLTKK